MAVGRRDIPVTREQVHGWIQDAVVAEADPQEYIQEQLQALSIGDEELDTPDETTTVYQAIFDDLGSYG